MPEFKRRTLDEYRSFIPWLAKAGLNDEELRRIPVHEAPDTVEASLGLCYVSPDAPPAVPGEVVAYGTRQLYVYHRDVPADLWYRLEAAIEPSQPSGYRREGLFTGLPDVVVRDEDRDNPKRRSG